MPDRNTRHLAAHRELVQEFAAADRDKDGRIDFGEFRLLLEGLEAACRSRRCKSVFAKSTPNRDGWIDCREFADWWSSD